MAAPISLQRPNFIVTANDLFQLFSIGADYAMAAAEVEGDRGREWARAQADSFEPGFTRDVPGVGRVAPAERLEAT
jgi:hypothetical protein